MGIAPEVTLVFKALVVITVCLLQAPKVRDRLVRRRRPRPSARADRAEPAARPESTPDRSTGTSTQKQKVAQS
jgi:simple sugar transport system permease protein